MRCLLALAALLLLQCWMPLALGDDSQAMNIGSLPSVGTVTFKGSSLRVFEIDGVQVAEPRAGFGDSSCDPIKFNHLFLKYQLTLPISIDANTLETPTDSSKKVGQVTLTGLRVEAVKALTDKDAQLSVMARLKTATEAQLIFLCDTFVRCQRLKDEIVSNPEDFRDSIKLIPVGRIGSTAVKFGTIRSANLPNFNCNPGQWIVFQRRIDGNLSFAQNWDAYVKGFGNPESNYWMGLERLFALTVTSIANPYPITSRCQLRVETEDFNGKKYWGEYGLFEVLGPEQNYRLRLGQEVSGSQLASFIAAHNEMDFSTYDRDHDRHGTASCSQLYGFGGWWYNGCHSVNLNGAYSTDKSTNANPTYATIYIGSFVAMKTTLMKFKCF